MDGIITNGIEACPNAERGWIIEEMKTAWRALSEQTVVLQAMAVPRP